MLHIHVGIGSFNSCLCMGSALAKFINFLTKINSGFTIFQTWRFLGLFSTNFFMEQYFVCDFLSKICNLDELFCDSNSNFLILKQIWGIFMDFFETLNYDFSLICTQILWGFHPQALCFV